MNMKNLKHKELSLRELEEEKILLEGKIQHLTDSLRCPLVSDLDFEAAPASNLIFRKKFLELEYSNLKWIRNKIQLLKDRDQVFLA